MAGTKYHLQPTSCNGTRNVALAMALAAATGAVPGLRIPGTGGWQAAIDLGDATLPGAGATDDLRRLVVAAHAIASGMRERVTTAMEALEWGGLPSAFTAEDDDARDLVVAELAAGGRITKDFDRTRDDDRTEAFLADGTPIPCHIMGRIDASDLIEHSFLAIPRDAETHTWTVGLSEAGRKRLDGRQATRALRPRDHAVPFDAFAEYCRYRYRGEESRDCTHPDSSWDAACACSRCPIMDAAYASEGGAWYTRGFDDPANEIQEAPLGILAVARHVVTERSYAFRASGESRVIAVVNEVLHSHFAYGAPMLLDAPKLGAAREAVAAGHIEPAGKVFAEDGDVFRPSTTLLARLAAERAERDTTKAARA